MTRRCWLPAVLAVGLLLAGCGTVHPTVAELRALPGAESAYPGSVAVGGHGETQGKHSLFDSTASVLFTTYCSTAQQQAVTRWFAAHLEAAGWQAESNPAGTTSTDVAETQEWSRGDRIFLLQVLSPSYVTKLGAPSGRPCTTGYRTTVQ